MPKKCGVAGCNGNYNSENKCCVFRVPKDAAERQKWLDVLPVRDNFEVNADKFIICERHWNPDPPMINLPGGSTRPSIPPSVFPNVPKSCLPTPKPEPRTTNKEDRQLEHFRKKDKIVSFETFSPEKELHKTYKNVIIHRTGEKILCLFMAENFHECTLTVIVENKPTLCSPLILSAYKDGVSVSLGKILNPNRGLASYSQFYEAVRLAVMFEVPLEEVLKKVVCVLQGQQFSDMKKEKKLKFVTHQLELLGQKQFSMSDYCFAVETFPRCSYEQLREYLVLPSKTKVRGIVASVDRDKVLERSFEKMERPQQRNVMLLVDEVQIRPTLAFSGGILGGMAQNNPECRATHMLAIMMKSLHRGPSVMISVTPVHKLTAAFQFNVVREAAAAVEKAGGRVIGSITDNHRINQQFCKLFGKQGDCPATATHPLDERRVWFLVYDTVHLLKCIRNNWLTERTLRLSLDKENVASFSDVRDLYNAEKDSVLKTTTLTHAAVYPTRLQLQNVQHVLKVFDVKVVAALRLRGCKETACFIETVLHWWNMVNISAKGQDQRLGDPH